MSATAVVIVGGGPVGLLLACELGVRDIPVILVDANPALVRHHKANTHSARSMEIYRKHGISHGFRKLGLPPNRSTDIGYFTRLFGHELFRVPLPSPSEALIEARTPGTRWPTPEPPFRASQMMLEPLLLERARSFPSVDIRYSRRVTALEQDERGVTVTVALGDGSIESIEAQYLAGCDGGNSFVRRALGIRFAGDNGLDMDFLGGRMLATSIHAPTLLERFPHRDTWMHWTMTPSGRGIVVLIDPDAHEFLVHFQLQPHEQPEDVDFAARLTDLLGESLPHEVFASSEWRAGLGLVAEHYRSGRCLLAGDAAHLFTPTGGFGLNTGIEDAFNLGWKLAAVCRGQAETAILDTYESERRPIAVRNTDYARSLARNAGSCPVSDDLDDAGEIGESARAKATDHLKRFATLEFETSGIQLGARYDGSPLILSGDGAIPVDDPADYAPSATPGGRLPHVWLADGSSVFDALGPEFTAIGLRGDALAPKWLRAAEAAHVELTVVDLSNEHGLAALYGADWVLVRPDQHIAWRGDPAAVDLERVLRTVSGSHVAQSIGR